MTTKKILQQHPCFNQKAHNRFARIHLSVAPLCNICCKYCVRTINKTENRPGVAAKILSPREALRKVKTALNHYPLTVVGIAGPGDPLANKETLQTFRLINKTYPRLMKCMSTNGLMLPEYTEFLKEINLSTLTITVNAINPETAEKIYDYVVLNKKIYKGKDAAKILIERQKEGIKKALRLKIPVKINTVLIPEINSKEITKIARFYGSMGIYIMNIMPLIPLFRMSSYRTPTCQELRSARDKSEKYTPQFRQCKQCRSDAMGIPGLEKKDHLIPTEHFHF